MVLVNIDLPKNCRECPMSCQINGDNQDIQNKVSEILCNVDWRKHEPMNKGCPIKGEVKENRWIYIVPGDEEDESDLNNK